MLFAATSWIAFNVLINEINLQWGQQFAERQVLFDKHRTLSPLIREIHLVLLCHKRSRGLIQLQWGQCPRALTSTAPNRRRNVVIESGT